LHLVTAADGAEEFYAGINNEARYESVEQARDKDSKVQHAYQGHSRLFIVDNNCVDFNAKIKRCQQHCQQVLGITSGTSFYKKYLLVKKNLANGFAFPVDFGNHLRHEVLQTIETWLKPQDKNEVERSIEKKGSNKAYTYTLKSTIDDKGQKQLKKKAISSAEYVENRLNADESR